MTLNQICNLQKLRAKLLPKLAEVPPLTIFVLALENLRQKLIQRLREILKLQPAAVLCQGEFNYTFALVSELKQKNIPALAATSERVTTEIVQPDGSSQKIFVFRFVRFRRY